MAKVKSFIIVLTDNKESTDAASKLIMSSRLVKNEFNIETFDAITPERVDNEMILEDITWNYPWDESKLCLRSGLYKHPYKTEEPKKRIACFLSHYKLWKLCVDTDTPIIILEDDAIFTEKVNLKLLDESRFQCISLNDPRGATRRSSMYHSILQNQQGYVLPVPSIDQDTVPQGLPGHSAYYIEPSLARRMLELVREFGAWPNDAIMCRQLLPSRLGCIRDYCTRVQGTVSTTTT